ncbi:MAG: glycosyltransferase [Myxococcota bacterium]
MPLSVVVPAFDAAPTLARCLSALVAALPDGGEIVVVDDGSRDATAAIAAGFPARLLRQANRGTSAARNAGVAAARHDLIAFVDADVVVRPDALRRLVAALGPEDLGANGILALDLTTPGLVSAFANTSIHFQHLRHGKRVATAFTALCVLRREALDRMGGWDERWHSRYADDVATRWHLPAGSIRLVPEATGEHLKPVRLAGLLKHRFNIGWFWVRSVGAHREKADRAVLDLRYPLNTIAAVGLLTPAAPVAAGIAVAANARFVAFTLRERGAVEAAAALPLSVLEGFAYAAGVISSVARGRADARPPE